MSLPFIFERPLRAVRERYATELAAQDNGITYARLGASLMSAPLDMYRIGTGDRCILYVGAQRGGDWMTSCLMYRFLYDTAQAIILRQTYGGVDPFFFFSRYSLFVVPMLNVDGCELCMTGEPMAPLDERLRRMSGGEGFASWQANARGVDLCRNYDYAHAVCKTQEKARGIEAGACLYSGEYPESEPEVHALANLVRTVRWQGVVALYLGEGGVCASPKGRASAFRTAGRIAHVLHEPLGEAGTACGELCGYAGERLGIPSFAVTLGVQTGPCEGEQLRALYPRVQAMLARFPLFL